ncbi:helix-turn-helix transcriptional regulator [Rhodococcus sp. NPDC003318]|uniref:helix-turn-helix transcriptional regulator n=1 Tax=Rhodococcus sp. NPDC003318 TaxID=3364503 RepID=UPI0036A2514F
MRPIIIDEDTGRRLWTAAECSNHAGVTRAGWRGYVARGQAPASVGHLDERTPLWWADEVEQWQRDRPGVAGRPRSRDTEG